MQPMDLFPSTLEIINLNSLQLLALLLVFVPLIHFFQMNKVQDKKNSVRTVHFLQVAFAIQIVLTVILLLGLENARSLKIIGAIFPYFIFLSICILAWVWGFPKPNPKVDFIFYAYLIITLLLFFLEITFSFFIQIVNLNIPSLMNLLLAFVSFVFLLFVIIILLAKRPGNWFAGILFALISILGIGSLIYDLGTTQTLTLTSLIFFEVIAFAFLPLLSITSPSKSKITQGTTANLISKQALDAWLTLIQPENMEQFGNHLINALGNTFKADKAVLVRFRTTDKKNENVIFIAGDDKHKSKEQGQLKQLPLIVNSWSKQKKPLVLFKEDKFTDNQLSMFETIDYDHPVNMLYYPIFLPENKDESFGLFLFSQEIRWGSEDLKLLGDVDNELIRILKYIPEFRNSDAEDKRSLERTKPTNILLKTEADRPTGLFISDVDKIHRLEAELKLVLEEYDRLHKLLEENLRKSSINRK